MTDQVTAAGTLSAADTQFENMGRHWGWSLALGVLFIILGVAGLGASLAMTITTVFVFGVMTCIGGISQLIEALKCSDWKLGFPRVLMGVLYIGAGIILFTEPLAGAFLLTIVLGITIVFVGLARIVMALQFKGVANTLLLIVSGVVSIMLGCMILLQWPVSGLWIIGFMVAVEMIMHGISYVRLAMASRSA